MKSLNSYPPLVTVFNFWTACTSLHWTDYVHHFCISKALQKQAGKRNWSSCPSQPSSHNHVLPECQLEQTKPICTHFGTATPTIAFSFNITLHHHSPSHLSMVNSTKLCAKLITDLFCRKKFSRKSFKISVKDIVTLNRKHMQHTTVSHDLELITSMETEEVTDTTYVSKRFDSNRGLSDSKPIISGGFP